MRDEYWTPEAYQESLREYSEALEETSPGLPVAGPGAYAARWWRAFAESGIPNQQALSVHWYPLSDCEGPASSPADPTIEDLLSPDQRDRAKRIVTMGSEVGQSTISPCGWKKPDRPPAPAPTRPP